MSVRIHFYTVRGYFIEEANEYHEELAKKYNLEVVPTDSMSNSNAIIGEVLFHDNEFGELSKGNEYENIKINPEPNPFVKIMGRELAIDDEPELFSFLQVG
jgi:hypothetical protein